MTAPEIRTPTPAEVCAELRKNAANAQTLQRLVEMGVQPYLAASTVNMVVAQRLVRRICPHCERTVKPTEKALAQYEERHQRDRHDPERGSGRQQADEQDLADEPRPVGLGPHVLHPSLFGSARTADKGEA
mgnify:CR=1 FL=1